VRVKRSLLGFSAGLNFSLQTLAQGPDLICNLSEELLYFFGVVTSPSLSETPAGDQIGGHVRHIKTMALDTVCRHRTIAYAAPLRTANISAPVLPPPLSAYSRTLSA
jgi:hypothetical protein